jgi:P27 family predicted phage terminase small subunit
MGRKAKPTILKLASGTFKTSDAPKHEPKYEALEDLSVPGTLNEQGPGARKWRELAEHLASRGCLTNVDRQNLEAYCMAYETMLKADEEIKNYGSPVMQKNNGDYVTHPAVTVYNTTASTMIKFGTILGLDPASRSKIEGKPPGGSATSFKDLQK